MPNSDAIPRTPSPDAAPGWLLKLKEKLGLVDPVDIIPFRSFGTPDLLHLRGRVIERKEVNDPTEDTNLFENIRDTLHRFMSEEIPGARVRAHLDGQTWDVTTDNEGFFVFDLEPDTPFGPGWHEVTLELVDTLGAPREASYRAPVLVPNPDAAYGIITDMDDTVIKSHATNIIQQAALLLTNDATDHTPLPGVPALYRAFVGGPEGQSARAPNPIFYVSRSGWNVYDLFTAFLDHHDIPKGPFFLRDLRITEDRSTALGSDDDTYKFEQIDLLLRTYPDLPFLLVGDSGQHDPEAYLKVIRAHPDRIRAAYIHDVSKDGRDAEVKRIAQEAADLGTPMLLCDSTGEMAEHAASIGLLPASAVDDVRAGAAAPGE